MHQPTLCYYFLGANSSHGFFSLYDQFAPEPNDLLHIIKGGPGTGKSTFMKRIGEAAEERGFDVEYILCSGDPDSLDGVYLPQLHTAWVDGTSPHVIEPRYFGLNGTYVDLGQFCRFDALTAAEEPIRAWTALYKSHYQRAYSYLQAAGALSQPEPMIPPSVIGQIRKRAQAKIRRELSPAPHSAPKVVKRFLRAISCQGEIYLTQTLDVLCDRLILLNSHLGLENPFFQELQTAGETMNLRSILCLSPLSPDQVEAIIFPDHRICFIAADSPLPFHGKVRSIHLDPYWPDGEASRCKASKKLQTQLLEAACQQLTLAKEAHDQLEQFYRPALDVSALDAYTRSVIENLFS